jgi:hypothetical protein
MAAPTLYSLFALACLPPQPSSIRIRKCARACVWCVYTLLGGENFVFAGWNQWEVLEAASDAPPPFRHLPLPGREHIVRLMNEAVENGMKAGTGRQEATAHYSFSHLQSLQSSYSTRNAILPRLLNKSSPNLYQYRSIRCNNLIII